MDYREQTEDGLDIRGWRDSKGNTWNIMIKTATINGRSEPVGLTVSASGEHTRLLQSTLREIPFTKFLQNWANYPHELSRSNSGITGAMTVSEPKRSRGSHPLTEGEMQRVVDVYLDAYENHLPLQQTVAQTLGIPLSTACKRINLVRKKGLLPRVERPNRKIAGSEPEGN